ncbi:PREDICTED: uncharacterized protein LOC104776663 [Camelina sativa]|uniref:Uncharacterized protein LOC104776663 n=1 Tax=Camelina sativa TaxID=90675 RepID=A0ABM1RDZ4_CAMSA|nr:PREDICTED: uncharacterized protein LOC104776663 [Camelina sativa]
MRSSIFANMEKCKLGIQKKPIIFNNVHVRNLVESHSIIIISIFWWFRQKTRDMSLVKLIYNKTMEEVEVLFFMSRYRDRVMNTKEKEMSPRRLLLRSSLRPMEKRWNWSNTQNGPHIAAVEKRFIKG